MNVKRVAVGAFVAVGFLMLPRATHKEPALRLADTRRIADIRRIHTAEVEYFSRYGRFGGLFELGPGGVGLLTGDLAKGRSNGQMIIMRVTATGYTIQTAPIENSGQRFRSFFSDQTLKIRQSYGSDLASASSPELK